MNPGGGERIFRVVLTTAEPDVAWRAGDIAELALPTGELRSYSIASMPDEGRLDLLVREVRAPDGTLGRGTAWLLHDVRPGDEISLRVRAHAPFHAPAAEGALLLVGAGSGLAGLRPHILEARPRRQPVWLIYGERHSDRDNALCRELNAWHREGRLYRFNLALSRPEAGEGAYVQDIMVRYAADLQAYLGACGVVMTCGGRAMGAAIEQALRTVCGHDWVDAAFAEARYRQALF
jgi:sulfite reductase (NADPH) flavoprotein alpha-component